MKIIWSPRALERASEYADFIAKDSKTRSKKWLTDLFEVVKRLEVFPESAPVLRELNDPKIRDLRFKNFRVIYEVKKSEINILTIRRFRRPLDLDELK